jgi:hypothetical protein
MRGIPNADVISSASGVEGRGMERRSMSLPPTSETRRERDGLCATFRTRVAADLAIEHLTQEYGIDPAFIYVEPVEDENSSGIETSGGDAASGKPSHGQRLDAPLHGVIQVTVPVEHETLATVRTALEDAGAISIETF